MDKEGAGDAETDEEAVAEGVGLSEPLLLGVGVALGESVVLALLLSVPDSVPPHTHTTYP